MGRPTPTSRTIGVTAAAAVVFIASFLPWGTIRGTTPQPFKIDSFPAMELMFSVGGWNSHINVLGLILPNWLVIVVALAVASSCWLKDLGHWQAPRHLPCVLAGFGLFQSIWMAFVLLGSGRGTIGIGLLTTILAFGGMIVALVRGGRPHAKDDTMFRPDDFG